MIEDHDEHEDDGLKASERDDLHCLCLGETEGDGWTISQNAASVGS